jgi:hypothetical protein
MQLGGWPARSVFAAAASQAFLTALVAANIDRVFDAMAKAFDAARKTGGVAENCRQRRQPAPEFLAWAQPATRHGWLRSTWVSFQIAVVFSTARCRARMPGRSAGRGGVLYAHGRSFGNQLSVNERSMSTRRH